MRTSEGRLGSMTYESKRFALDAIGAKVVATPERSTLHEYLPSYVTIARTSGCMLSRDQNCFAVPFKIQAKL